MEQIKKAFLLLTITTFLISSGCARHTDATTSQEEADTMASLAARVMTLESQIGTPTSGLQAMINSNTVQLLELQSNHNVTSLIDPCGDGPGYDEIFLRTSTGKIIASFSDSSSGTNTRFAELTAGGPYQTTDGTHCTFSVVMGSGGLEVVSTPATVEY